MITVPAGNYELIYRALKDSFVPIEISTIKVSETPAKETGCSVDFTIGTQDIEYSWRGVGMVDAIFEGLKRLYVPDYPSLNTIELMKFSVKAKSRGTEAEVEVEVTVKNGFGGFFDFMDCSKSLTAASARVCAEVVQYFVNSEKAYRVLHRALQDAQGRSRQDLVTRYTEELTQLVRSTSYSEILEKVYS